MLPANDENPQPAARRSGGKRNKGRLKLLETAERMFAEHGVDAISIRQITLEAGQSNNSAVAHHFGSKEDLLLAIFRHRSVEVDSAERRRLQQLDEAGDDSVRGLLGALLLPLAEDLEPRGEATFAVFLARLHALPPERHPINVQPDIMPTASAIEARLKAKLSFLPSGVFNYRYRLVTGMFYSGILERFHIMHRVEYFGLEEKLMINDLLNMCAAALAEPLQSFDLNPA